VTLAAVTLAAALAAALAGAGQAPAAPREPDPLFFGAVERARVEAVARRGGPRLVVLLVIDQMRAEFLPRLLPWLPGGGFRRLWDEGAVYRNCRIPYAATLTGPGHATLSTGANPWLHGIVGNAWFDGAAEAQVGCVSDTAVRPLGGGETPSASPHRLRAPTLGDALRTETLGIAKVVAIAGKDRSAILLAGHRPTGAYWLDGDSNLLVSSDYYVRVLPAWAESARAETAGRLAAAGPWTTILEPAAYLGTLPTEGQPSFPSPAPPAEARRIAASPLGIELLFQAARWALQGEGLGSDGVPDLLALGVSATDLVGHEFGPESPEYLDLCARLDREVADLLSELDRAVGRGAYTVAVTADHGVGGLPAVARLFEAAPSDSSGPWPASEVRAWADERLDALAPGGFARDRSWVRAFSSGFVTLDERLLAGARLELERAVRALVDAAMRSPWLAGAYSPLDERRSRLPEGLRAAAERSLYPGRSGHVLLLPRPFVSFGSRAVRADHGTPHAYDTRVPLLLWGRGVRAGEHWEEVETTDLAPTLAALLGVRAPAACEGRVLAGALGAVPPGSRPGR
jgi:predicted AlkP superfamily pyrophosphatase or phosphodiesterase